VTLAILASGTGTILEAILERGLPVRVVLADRRCRALDVARAAGIATELVERTDFTKAFDRALHTADVVAALARHDTTTVAMAGYMTILSPAMFEAYAGRVLNTHPSLLPAFPGAHAVRDALQAGVAQTGCTVHVATAIVDDGPILAQEAVAVREDDTEDSLHERIKAVERRLYPATIEEFLDR
jgi:phosphoribosylglycinamide formyltransferase-1